MIKAVVDPITVSIKDKLALSQLKDCDQLQFRGQAITSRLIKMAGRGVHSHSAKLIWVKGIPFVVEVREWVGGRAVTLESQVKKYPGQIDVFRTNPDNSFLYSREKAAKYMLHLCGSPYGWGHIKVASFAHLFGVRLITEVNLNDDDLPKGPPFCSEACAIADRLGGGYDPVPYLSDDMTYPADLTRSTFYKYLFTLVP